ncbi:MAG: LPS assembly protein LptD [Burkholderiales bacterium]|nr:LPS assembly protein LptD [Burkholderiales bacterium]
MSRHFHAALALLALALCGPAAGQGQGLRLHRAPAQQAGESIPAFVIADRIEGVAGVQVEAVGNAELHRGATSLFADRIRYVSEFDEAEATGNVRLRMDGDEIAGPRLRLRVGDNAGVMNEPRYTLVPRAGGVTGRAAAPTGARGTAQAARFDGRDNVRITDGTFTTCKPGQDDWQISAEQLDLDLGREVGVARGARLTFLGMKTPALPEVGFSLNNRRKSGFLPPSVGISNARGWEVLAPYYLNLAPNYDATVAPRYMERRGLQLISQFRYLLPSSRGEARVEVLPEDKATGEARWGVALRDTSIFGASGWSSSVNYTRVSDDQYFRDLSGRLAVATQVFLPQEGSVTYGGRWWSSTLRLQRFQTLQDPANLVTTPYARLPQLTLTALRPTRLGLDLGASAEAVAFDHPSLVQGRRTTAYPYIAWPFVKPYGFFTPKIGVHATHYSLTDAGPGTPTSQSRVLPIALRRLGALLRARRSLVRHRVPADARAARLLLAGAVPRADRHSAVRHRDRGSELWAALLGELLRRRGPDQRREPAHHRGDVAAAAPGDRAGGGARVRRPALLLRRAARRPDCHDAAADRGYRADHRGSGRADRARLAGGRRRAVFVERRRARAVQLRGALLAPVRERGDRRVPLCARDRCAARDPPDRRRRAVAALARPVRPRPPQLRRGRQPGGREPRRNRI